MKLEPVANPADRHPLQLPLDQIDAINAALEPLSPAEIVGWAWARFGPKLAATSSFQTQSLPLLHIIATHAPDLPIYFLDTGFHFPETLAYRDALMARLGVRVHNLAAQMGRHEFQRRHGELFRTHPDLCCYINKVEPWQQVRQGLTGWITGIRRDQTENRRNTPILTVERSGQVKICPIATWTERDVWRYINQYDLPVHPLMQQGYLSIGCAPCTRPVSAGEDARAGRWAGQAKTECGLHTDAQPASQPAPQPAPPNETS